MENVRLSHFVEYARASNEHWHRFHWMVKVARQGKKCHRARYMGEVAKHQHDALFYEQMAETLIP